MSRGKRPARYVRFRDSNNDHRWRVTGGNGKPMSGSLEGYRRQKRMEESAIDAAVAVLEALAPERLKWTAVGAENIWASEIREYRPAEPAHGAVEDALVKAARELVAAWDVGASSADATEGGHLAIGHRIKLAKDALRAALATRPAPTQEAVGITPAMVDAANDVLVANGDSPGEATVVLALQAALDATRPAPVALSSEEERSLRNLEQRAGSFMDVARICELVRRLTTNEPKGD